MLFMAARMVRPVKSTSSTSTIALSWISKALSVACGTGWDFRDNALNFRISDGDYSLRVKGDGDVDLKPDGSGVASLDRGGSFDITLRRDGAEREPASEEERLVRPGGGVRRRQTPVGVGGRDSHGQVHAQ